MSAPTPPSTPSKPSTTVAASHAAPAASHAAAAPKPPPLLTVILERTPKGVAVNGRPFPTLAQARLYALDLLAKVRE